MPREDPARPRRPSGPRVGDSRDRDSRAVAPRVEAPPIADGVEYGQLDRSVRQRLRTLSKENAEDVGRHLIMAGLLLDDDPEAAYRHAQTAVARAGRVDVVREAAALAAYATGRYAEALRELRTVRRLSGTNDHLALEADCERGLGRPERAIAIAKTPEAERLEPRAAAELQIVVAGARLDLGEPQVALLILERIPAGEAELGARVREAKADVLRALGRDAEADALTPDGTAWDDGDDVIVYDASEEEDDGNASPPEDSEETLS